MFVCHYTTITSATVYKQKVKSAVLTVPFGSVSWPIWSFGEHDGRFSRHPLPVFPAGGQRLLEQRSLYNLRADDCMENSPVKNYRLMSDFNFRIHLKLGFPNWRRSFSDFRIHYRLILGCVAIGSWTALNLVNKLSGLPLLRISTGVRHQAALPST